MLRGVHFYLASLLGLVTAFCLACSDDDGGGGGGGAQIQSSQDGQYVGFLWKPRSESNGNLVVLLPEDMRGQVAAAGLYNDDVASQGTLIEPGRFAGDTHNGNRPHFRFNESGATYGGDIWLIAELSDGSRRAWHIPNGASRWD